MSHDTAVSQLLIPRNGTEREAVAAVTSTRAFKREANIARCREHIVK